MKQLLFVILLVISGNLFAQKTNKTEPVIVNYDPFVWNSEPPKILGKEPNKDIATNDNYYKTL